MYEMTPGRLAKELGVPKLDMWHAMQELRINAKRMDARVSDRQVGALRTYYSNKQRARARRAAQAVVRDRPSSVPPIPVAREFPRTCPCCDRRWVHRGIEDLVGTLCPQCEGHRAVPGEDIERRLARAEQHAAIYSQERDAAYEAVQESHRLRVAAYDSRAKWRAAVAEVVLDHDEGPDGLCWCGHALPCRTWMKLDEANRGIHRQVEKWSSWSEARLEEFLYGESRARSSVIDEDEPEDDDVESVATGA